MNLMSGCDRAAAGSGSGRWGRGSPSRRRTPTSQRRDHVDEPRAQLVQVLEERHLVGIGQHRPSRAARSVPACSTGSPSASASAGGSSRDGVSIRRAVDHPPTQRLTVGVSGGLVSSGSIAGSTGDSVRGRRGAAGGSLRVLLRLDLVLDRALEVGRGLAELRPSSCPGVLPISGSLRGPKTMSAMTRMRMISGPPSVPNIGPDVSTRTRLRRLAESRQAPWGPRRAIDRKLLIQLNLWRAVMMSAWRSAFTGRGENNAWAFTVLPDPLDATTSSSAAISRPPASPSCSGRCIGQPRDRHPDVAQRRDHEEPLHPEGPRGVRGQHQPRRAARREPAGAGQDHGPPVPRGLAA